MPTLFESDKHRRQFRLVPFWVCVWFIVFISFLKISSDSFYKNGEAQFIKYDQKFFKWMSGEEFKDDLKIIMIGNSRLRNALDIGLYQPAKITLPDGRKAVVLQFSYDASAFNDYKTIAPVILEHKPDLLIVQNTVLTNTHKKDDRLKNMADRLMQYVGIKIQGMDAFDAWVHRRTHAIDVCFDWFAEKRVESYVAFLQHSHNHALKDNVSLLQARDFLAQAVTADIPVAVLDIESNKKLLRRAGYDPVMVDYNGIGHVPEKSEILPAIHNDVRWLDYRAPEDMNIYCDVVHLNEDGKAHFKDWLIKKIPTLL